MATMQVGTLPSVNPYFYVCPWFYGRLMACQTMRDLYAGCTPSGKARLTRIIKRVNEQMAVSE